MTNSPKFLNRDAAAAYVRETWGLRCSPKTLAKYAVTGDGPMFRKDGQSVVYTAADLDTWAEKRVGPPIRSTAEIAPTTA